MLVGCGDGVPLDEVPIHGGTPEQREEARVALIGFDEAAGRGRVRLRAVRFWSSGDYLGMYRHATRVMLLGEDQEDLGSTVRHELCHALEEQQGLLVPIPEVLGSATEGLFGSGLTWELDGDRRYSDDDEQASETLAWFCEMGPYGAVAARSDGCDDVSPDPELRASLGDWLLDQVWQGFVLPEPLVLDPADEVVATFGSTLAVSPTDDPRVVVLGRGVHARHVDLYTGAPVDSDLPTVPGPEDGPDGVGTVWITSDGAVAGWVDGPSALIGTFDLFHLGQSARVMAADAGGWRFVGDGCPRDGQVVFTADERVWTAWPDAESVRWTSLGARPD